MARTHQKAGSPPEIPLEVREYCGECDIFVERKPLARGERIAIRVFDAKITGVEQDGVYTVNFLWVPKHLRRMGLGRFLVQMANIETGKPVVPDCVLSDAENFWSSMENAGLAHEPLFVY